MCAAVARRLYGERVRIRYVRTARSRELGAVRSYVEAAVGPTVVFVDQVQRKQDESQSVEAEIWKRVTELQEVCFVVMCTSANASLPRVGDSRIFREFSMKRLLSREEYTDFVDMARQVNRGTLGARPDLALSEDWR